MTFFTICKIKRINSPSQPKIKTPFCMNEKDKLLHIKTHSVIKNSRLNRIDCGIVAQ